MENDKIKAYLDALGGAPRVGGMVVFRTVEELQELADIHNLFIGVASFRKQARLLSKYKDPLMIGRISNAAPKYRQDSTSVIEDRRLLEITSSASFFYWRVKVVHSELTTQLDLF